MLYLAIDQHKTQLIINIQNEQGSGCPPGSGLPDPSRVPRSFAVALVETQRNLSQL